MNNYTLAINDGVEVDLIYITAIERWGRDAQMVKAAEEMAELSAVLLKYVNLAPDDAERAALKKRIIDEMADVEIMLEQLGIMSACNYDEYLFKLWRLSRRLGIKAGLRDLKFAIERVGDNFKPYGMNNWKGMVAVIDMVLQDPEKLMRSVSLTGYTIPEPYQGKYKKWAEKKRKEMAENRQQRLETCSMCKWREPNYPMPRGNDGWCCARYHTCNPWGEARCFEGRKNNGSNLCDG